MIFEMITLSCDGHNDACMNYSHCSKQQCHRSSEAETALLQEKLADVHRQSWAQHHPDNLLHIPANLTSSNHLASHWPRRCCALATSAWKLSVISALSSCSSSSAWPALRSASARLTLSSLAAACRHAEVVKLCSAQLNDTGRLARAASIYI